MHLFRMLTYAFAVITTAATMAAADKRVALVVGNSKYEFVSNLSNPANDATDIADSLRRLGFEVTAGIDMDYRQMRLALRDFADTAGDADIVLIYFAGHGVEIENTNYLIPVNAELKSDRDVDFEAIRLDAVVKAVSGTNGLKIILVDACRNNPFVSDMVMSTSTRSIGRGLGRIDPGGVLVGYAARGGTLALDGEGRNSPYAQALLKHIEEPGLELGKMFRKVRDSVYDATGGYQEPFTYGSLPGEDIFLLPPEPTEQTKLVVAAPLATDQNILADFAAADRNNKLYQWNRFLETYENQPDHEIVKLAALKRDNLLRETEINTRRLNREPWLKAEFPSDQREAVLTLEQRKLLQEALLYMGHDVGTIDGSFGPTTRNSIAAARLAASLPPGTIVDLPLLRALPNVPAMKELDTGKARSLDAKDLPESVEPRLAKLVTTLPRGEFLWGYYKGHLYVVVASSGVTNWHDAARQAKLAGGHLATITSADENRFIYDLFRQDPRFTKAEKGALYGPMFGLYQVDQSREPAGGWAWITGELLNYRNFSPGNPDNFQNRQHFARFFKSSKMSGSSSGPIWWDDTSQGIWFGGYVMEID
jgi:uncharacterized caspase-like protein